MVNESKYYTVSNQEGFETVQENPHIRDYFTTKEIKWVKENVNVPYSNIWYYVEDISESWEECLSEASGLPDHHVSDRIFNLILAEDYGTIFVGYDLEEKYRISIIKCLDDWFWVSMNWTNNDDYIYEQGLLFFKCDGFVGLKKALEDNGHLV